MRRLVGIGTIVWVLCLPNPAPAQREPIPPDFSLRAEYYPPAPPADIPGARRSYPWTMTIGADGRVEQESNRTVPGKRKIVQKSVRVSREAVARLVAEVRRANFHALAPEYAFEIAPRAVLVLRITLDGRTHDVAVYGPERLQDDAGVSAFLAVWNGTVAVAPPPGEDDARGGRRPTRRRDQPPMERP